ncbi:MAG: hypothetical protein K6D94_12330 [Clostridiales bacterium]|nr:hypothetical protein [Clostridiales bacterium]
MKKTLSLILAAVMAASALAACGGDGTAAPQAGDAPAPAETIADTAGTEAETRVTDALGSYDFGGADFNIYTRVNTSHYNFCTEEQSGDVLNDAIFLRNSRIAERFNIVFHETEYTDENDAKNNIMSGDDTFSLMNVRCTAANTLGLGGMCVDISRLPEIDLSRPYWDDELTKQINIGSSQFAAIGSTNLTVIDFMTALLFNKELVDRYQLGDLYGIVRSGGWTFDKLGEMAAAVTADLNGDSALNGDDQWGALGVSKLFCCSFIPSGGAWYIKKDSDNMPYCEMESDSHLIDVFEKIFAVLVDNSGWYRTSDNTNEGTEYMTMFRDGRGLFLGTLFFYIESLRDMEHDFGIVPYPKYDDRQSDYYGRVCFFDTAVIPVTVPDQTMSAAVLEASSCESYNTVIPAYKEIVLKSKYTRDEDSSQMIDLVMEHRVIDFGDTYLVGEIRDGYFEALFRNDKRDLVSAAAKKTKSVDKALGKMIDNYSEIAG